MKKCKRKKSTATREARNHSNGPMGPNFGLAGMGGLQDTVGNSALNFSLFDRANTFLGLEGLPGALKNAPSDVPGGKDGFGIVGLGLGGLSAIKNTYEAFDSDRSDDDRIQSGVGAGADIMGLTGTPFGSLFSTAVGLLQRGDKRRIAEGGVAAYDDAAFQADQIRQTVKSVCGDTPICEELADFSGVSSILPLSILEAGKSALHGAAGWTEDLTGLDLPGSAEEVLLDTVVPIASIAGTVSDYFGDPEPGYVNESEEAMKQLGTYFKGLFQGAFPAD